MLCHFQVGAMGADGIKRLIEEDGIVFLVYATFLTQTLISSMTDMLEKEAESRGFGISGISGVYTVFIELAQNIMNYSKVRAGDSSEYKPEGLIWVGRDKDEQIYYVQSRNVIDIKDKEKMEAKLMELVTMDSDAVKLRYRELRKNGRDAHQKGGGIGFYEVAKRATHLSYQFIAISENKFYFDFRVDISVKK